MKYKTIRQRQKQRARIAKAIKEARLNDNALNNLDTLRRLAKNYPKIKVK